MRQHDFTLLELVVVLAVMALTAALAVGVFRKDSPAKIMRESALGFQEFCARVRFQAMESGEERLVRLLPEEKKFFMAIPPALAEEKKKNAEESGETPEEESMEWVLPEGFHIRELEEEEALNEDGSLDLFLFLPDGGASGRRQFILHYGELTMTFEISPLTGMLRLKEEQEEQAQ